MSACNERLRVDLDYLLQTDLLNTFIPRIGQEQWQVVYAIRGDPPDSFVIFSGLLEREAVNKALETESWDLRIGDGLPGFSQSWEEGKTITTYHRFSEETIRPLVIYRDFYGAWPSYLELCEEFRHFHNLAEDRERGALLDFDESGYPIEVAWIREGEVKIYLPYLLQFLAATQLYLAIYFEAFRYSLIPLENVPKNKQRLEHRDDRSRYFRYVMECTFQPKYRTFSRLLGKIILPPPPIEQCGKWPFDKQREEPDVTFVIGVNPNGTLKEFTSNPDKLSNDFGANPGTPHYLTPVYFRREVLEKYYADPNRYSVEDGYLSCLRLWSMQIDNNHPTHVVAFLGDLGRDLPYKERLHWKQFNVPPPANAGISGTCFRRSFLAQFAEPESVDLIFRHEYQQLNKAWQEKMGWPLFLEPKPGDEYILKAIHIPATNSQGEFDEQVLNLTKLLVDSLNEEDFIAALDGQKVENEKGIGKFERFLRRQGFPHVESVIGFMRNLQELRSTGAAHRKGRNYEKTLIKLGLSDHRKQEVIKRLLEQAVAALRLLREFFLREERRA